MKVLTVLLAITVLYLLTAVSSGSSQIGRYQSFRSINTVLFGILDTTTGDVYDLRNGNKYPLGSTIER